MTNMREIIMALLVTEMSVIMNTVTPEIGRETVIMRTGTEMTDIERRDTEMRGTERVTSMTDLPESIMRETGDMRDMTGRDTTIPAVHQGDLLLLDLHHLTGDLITDHLHLEVSSVVPLMDKFTYNTIITFFLLSFLNFCPAL